jgi:hypothetical protein
MALGSSPAEVQQHSTRQQEKPPNNTAVSKSSLVGESRQKQSEHEKPYNKPPARKRNRDVGTDTAYAEDTDAMVSEVPRLSFSPSDRSKSDNNHHTGSQLYPRTL